MTPSRPRERGTVLVGVMVFMTLLMIFGGVFVQHVQTGEADEVERLLAETRAYWAMMGHLNYALSRAAAGGLCAASGKEATLADNAETSCTGDGGGFTGYPSYIGRGRDSRIGSIQDYLDGTGEIQNGTVETPGDLAWYYPENAITNGVITGSNPANTANPNTVSIRAVVSERLPLDENDGEVRIDLEVVATGAVGALRDLPDRIGRLTVGLCVVDTYDASGLNGYAPTAGTNFCQPASTAEGTARIQFLQRNFAAPL